MLALSAWPLAPLANSNPTTLVYRVVQPVPLAKEVPAPAPPVILLTCYTPNPVYNLVLPASTIHKGNVCSAALVASPVQEAQIPARVVKPLIY